MNDETQYQAYLVRFQRGTNQPHWRVTVQNAQTGEQVCFANERDLFYYLVKVLDIAPQNVNRPNIDHHS